MPALREDWYLSPTGGESQGMRDLLRVKLPLSVCVCGGAGRKRKSAAQISLRKSVRPALGSALSSSPPPIGYSGFRRQTRSAPDQCLPLPVPSSAPSQGTAPPGSSQKAGYPLHLCSRPCERRPVLAPPWLRCPRHAPRSVLLMKFETDLSLPCFKPSKDFLPSQGLPAPSPRTWRGHPARQRAPCLLDGPCLHA